MIYPTKKVYITQPWGVNKVVYSQFGLEGHNGIDLRVYDEDGNRAVNGSLLAPHDGEIIEARWSDGYGWYYKIENDKEGSILGHNKTLFLGVGQMVKEGDVIGITNSTGFSTGAHIHWGYYLKPRDRNNGYGGTIDQVPLLEGGDMPEQTPLEACLDAHGKLMREAKEKDDEIVRLKIDIKTLEEKVRELEAHECPIVEIPEDTDKWKANGKKVSFEENGISVEINYAIDESEE